MYAIGANVTQGLITEAAMLKGKGMTPGSIVTTNIGGDAKVFVSVKLGATTWINGTVLLLDTGTSVAVVVTASGAPIPVYNQRVGVLVFASATATQTLSATGIGWAQIYGSVLARVSASVTLPGTALGLGSAAGRLIQQVGLSASAMMHGISSMATNTASVVASGAGLFQVFLNYPCFIGPTDTNLS